MSKSIPLTFTVESNIGSFVKFTISPPQTREYDHDKNHRLDQIPQTPLGSHCRNNHRPRFGPSLGGWGRRCFIDKTVDEDFPALVNAVMPAGMSMPDADATMEAAMDAPTEVEEEMMEAMGAMLAPEAVKWGEFRDGDAFHKGSGMATIYNLGTDGYVLRFEDFNVINGPEPAGVGDDASRSDGTWRRARRRCDVC